MSNTPLGFAVDKFGQPVASMPMVTREQHDKRPVGAPVALADGSVIMPDGSALQSGGLSAAQQAAGATGVLSQPSGDGMPIDQNGKRWGPRGQIAGALLHRPRVLLMGHSVMFQSGIQFAGLNNSGASDLRSGAAALVASGAQTISDLTKIAYMAYTGEVETNVVHPAVTASTSLTLTNTTKRMVRASASGTWNTYTTNQPSNIRQGIGIHTAALALNGWPLEIINPTYGYGGSTAEQIMQDLPTYLARVQPDIVWLHPFENSLAAAESWATLKPALQEMIAACLKWGAQPWIFTSVPSASFTTAGICSAFDSMVAYVTGTGAGTMAADFPMAIGINCSLAWRDTSQDATPKRVVLAGYADTDGLHPDGNHRFKCATATNNSATSVAAQIAANLPSFAGNRFAGCLNANPSLAGTGGTASGLQGGSVVPPSYTLTAEAGVTCTSTKNGGDDSLNVVASVAGASNISSTRVLLNNTAFTLPNNFGATNALRGAIRCRLNSQTNMALLQFQIVFSGGETHSIGQLETNWMTDPAIVGSVIDLETAAVVVPDGATTAQLQLLLRPQTLGSASGVLLNADFFEFRLKPANVL